MKYRSVFAALTAAATLLSACGEQETIKKQETSASTDSINIITIAPSRLGSMEQLPGVIEPFEVVQIYPRVSGFVKKVLVDRGSKVRKGQPLIEIEAPELNERLAEARLKYSEGKALLQNSTDRYNRLLETSKTPGTVSPYDLSSAQSKMKADESMVEGELANVRAQEAMCAYLTISAPFDGVITERNIHPGALVNTGNQNTKPLLVLQQQDKYRLVVSLPEQLSSQVKDNDAVTYKINALPGLEFKGRISRSSGALSDRFRSETIEIDVPNDNKIIKTGMYAEVQIPTSGNSNSFVLPKTAVVTTTERKYVVAVAGNKTKWVDVTTGNETNDSTEVFGMLKDGDKVIANATYNIKDGANVNGQKIAGK